MSGDMSPWAKDGEMERYHDGARNRSIVVANHCQSQARGEYRYHSSAPVRPDPILTSTVELPFRFTKCKHYLVFFISFGCLDDLTEQLGQLSGNYLVGRTGYPADGGVPPIKFFVILESFKYYS